MWPLRDWIFEESKRRMTNDSWLIHMQLKVWTIILLISNIWCSRTDKDDEGDDDADGDDDDDNDDDYDDDDDGDSNDGG